MHQYAPLVKQRAIFSMVSNDNKIYGLTDGGYIFCYSISKKKTLWSKKFFNKIRYSSSAGRPNLLNCNDGYIYGTTGRFFFRLNKKQKEIQIIKEGVTGYIVSHNKKAVYLNISEGIFKFKDLKN